MNRKELEKMFDDEFTLEEVETQIENCNRDMQEAVKDFIFDEIIPEVLRELLKVNGERSNDFTRSKVSGNFIIRDIKKQAKNLYGITL